MPTLEYMVRPWQARDSQGRVIIPSTPVGTHERATIQWGATGSLPVAQNLGPANSVGCCGEKQDELSRKTEDVTITDSANPDNYIVVGRATQLSLSKNDHNGCASNWDQFSGIGMEITDALAQFANNVFDSPLLAGDQTDQTCKSVIDLNNNTIAAQ
jgi:hypothetical protein